MSPRFETKCPKGNARRLAIDVGCEMAEVHFSADPPGLCGVPLVLTDKKSLFWQRGLCSETSTNSVGVWLGGCRTLTFDCFASGRARPADS